MPCATLGSLIGITARWCYVRLAVDRRDIADPKQSEFTIRTTAANRLWLPTPGPPRVRDEHLTQTTHHMFRLDGARKTGGAIRYEAAAEDQVHRPRHVVAEDDLDDITHLMPPHANCAQLRDEIPQINIQLVE